MIGIDVVSVLCFKCAASLKELDAVMSLDQNSRNERFYEKYDAISMCTRCSCY